MIDISDPYGLRAFNRDKLRQNEADAEARTMRLDPSKVDVWTALVAQVGKNVVHGKTPCSYEPWKDALKEFSRKPSYVGKLPEDWRWVPTDLMNFAADVARPGWPEHRLDLIEFAIVFLEADVMLFRSGYVKRHLIRRLQQSELTEGQLSRVDALLRRAITHGTGVEEFRAFRKLAAHLYVHGHLADLAEWLEKQSDGAILTIDRGNCDWYPKIFEVISALDRKRVASVDFFGPSNWGIVYPKMKEVVGAGKIVKEPSQKVKYSAFLMLDTIRRRRASERI